MLTPRVSVVMPALNAEAYLTDAIKSLQGQSLHDFELIVVDDGSTDKTVPLAQSYAKADPRIRVFTDPVGGIAPSLNRGITLAKGTYIARMDADDISLPHRLEKQVLFMDMHKDVAAAGTWVDTFGGKTKETLRHPTAPEFVAATLPFKCCLVHGSVMMRREVLAAERLAYETTFRHAEDYGLWARLCQKFKLANLAEVLVHCRVHDRQAMSEHRTQHQKSSDDARILLLASLGIKPTPDQARTHNALCEETAPHTMEFVRLADAWLRFILAANERTHRFDPIALAKVMATRWATLCIATAEQDWEVWKNFWASPLSAHIDRTQEKYSSIPAK